VGQAKVAPLPSSLVPDQKPMYIEMHSNLLHNVNIATSNIQLPPPVKSFPDPLRKSPDRHHPEHSKEVNKKFVATVRMSDSMENNSKGTQKASDDFPVKVIHCCKARTTPPGKSALGITALSVHHSHLGSLSSPEVQLQLDSGTDITLISEDCYKALEHHPKLQKGMKLSLFELTNQVKILGYINLHIFMPMRDNQILVFVEEAYVIPGMNIPILLGEDFQVNYEVSVLRMVQETCLAISQPGEQFNIVVHSTPPLIQDFQVWPCHPPEIRNHTAYLATSRNPINDQEH
jgi:hypothetical protein